VTRRWRLALCGLPLAASLGASDCSTPIRSGTLAAGDPLAGDPIAPGEDEPAELVPGAPLILPGPDDELGTADDVFVPGVFGDIDLVARVAPATPGAVFPPPAPVGGSLALAVAEPFGGGLPIPFVIAASDGDPSRPGGRPIVPAYFEGLPILVLAFADLDGDGFVGRTHLDGETRDGALEALELYPVGRRYAVVRHELAEGELFVGLGGPTPVGIALGAAAIAGPFDNPNLPCAGCHSWPSPAADRLFLPFIAGSEVAPEGPVVMTHLPFVPDTDVDYRSAPRGLVPAHPEARVGVQVTIALLPDPADPRIGESFTLPLDGSSASIDVASAVSGAAVRVGLALDVNPVAWQPAAGRAVRPAQAADGRRTLVEVITRMELTGETSFRAMPLDRLGNVAREVARTPVVLRAEGDVRIASPDADGDPLRESIVVKSVAGTKLRVAPLSPGAEGALVIDAGGSSSRVEFGPVSETFLFPSDVLFPPEYDGDGIGAPPGGGFVLDDGDDDDGDD
jgi:hypothetical protein